MTPSEWKQWELDKVPGAAEMWQRAEKFVDDWIERQRSGKPAPGAKRKPKIPPWGRQETRNLPGEPSMASNWNSVQHKKHSTECAAHNGSAPAGASPVR